MVVPGRNLSGPASTTVDLVMCVFCCSGGNGKVVSTTIRLQRMLPQRGVMWPSGSILANIILLKGMEKRSSCNKNGEGG